MYRRIAAAFTAVAVAACLAVQAAPSSAAPSAPLRASLGNSSAAAVTQSVTLVTGDTVSLRKLANGRQAGEFVPGEGREAVAFQQSEVDGDLYIYPEDALPLLDSGRLDPALFNVTELVSAGYDDQHVAAIPLILSYRKGIEAARTVTTRSLRAADVGAALESINGRAVAADKADAETFWESITSPSALSLDGGIERIWLDRKLKADLEHSVPQIGAPSAWEAGYDGAGVTVGVLDTGVDSTHPDLAGVVTATKNFTDSPTVEDKFGHGTHVSATIAGTGDASSGRRKGVAPGAKLVVGKVLDDDGYGYESWILDGMEWAVDSGASVVNLSLGGGPTDGTDPLSLGLNKLSADTGTLFVCSAGNDGEQGEFTVGTPGSADSALTVGAIDRNEALAPFSSRGPRQGDFAVKPDITAPGVGIVAARASGTSLGSPVDSYYTAASGTSMAAPHVAGAAAILAQRHPEWTGAQLKDGLASTASRNSSLSVYQQGGGRVDVERAVSQGVYGTATLDLGHLAANAGTGEMRKAAMYTNTTAAPVTLELSLAVKGPGGLPPADGSVAVGSSRVEVAPGSTVEVPIVVQPDVLARGRYGGYLEARTSDGSVVLHTSLGLMKDAPTHKVSFTAVGRDGKPATVIPFTFYGEDSRYDNLGYMPAGSTKTVEVAEGTYFLHGVISGGRAPDEEDYVLVDPAVSVTEDMHIVLDARKANKVVVETPKPAKQSGALSFYSHRDFGSRTVSHFHMEFDTVRNIYVTPTSSVAGFEFGTRWQKIAPMLTASAKGLALEPFYVHQSPALEGRKRLRAVDVGAGDPADYEGVDVRGKLAVVSASEENWDELTANAAAAGAAMALIVVKPTGSPWTKWTPKGERLPIASALVSNAQGTALIAALSGGRRVDVDLVGTPASPYLYDVIQVSRERVPEQVVYRVGSGNSATVAASYHDAGGGDWAKEQRFGWRPWQDSAINQYQRLVRTPQTRQELITAGDTLWQQNVKHYLTWDEMQKLSGGMTQAPRTYRAGERVSDSWFDPVVRPSIPREVVAGLGASRQGNVLRLRIPEWVDGGRGHYGLAEGDWGSPADTGHAKLFRDGALVYEGDWAWGDFETTAAAASYRLEMTVRRESPEWEFAPETETAWTFRSGRAASDSAAALPLLQVDYDLTTDLRNRAVAGLPYVIDLTGRQQPGVVGAAAVKSAALWTSYDDGATWTRAVVVAVGGGRYHALVWHPRLERTNGFVTLRVQASDKAGNTIEQTVRRAYGLR